ncbi:MAG: phage terminase-like protein large subunit, partial [Anaerocolumna sp.]|nr:phage terminase-like protein large subunit [Anaerocolumna sp.]
NIQPDKAKSKARIDGYVAFLCAYIAYTKCKDMFEAYQ